MRKATFAFAAVLIVLSIALALYAYFSVPSSTLIPIHWNALGQPDGFAGHWALFLFSTIALFVTLLLFWLILWLAIAFLPPIIYPYFVWRTAGDRMPSGAPTYPGQEDPACPLR